MKEKFSFGNVMSLLRKHLYENRKVYFWCIVAYAIGLVFMLWNAYHDNSSIICKILVGVSVIVGPVAFTKLASTPYQQTDKQIIAYTLPATQAEKFAFIFIWSLVCSFALWAVMVLTTGGINFWVLHRNPNLFSDWQDAIENITIWSGIALLSMSMSKGSPFKSFCIVFGSYLICLLIPILATSMLIGIEPTSIDMPVSVNALDSWANSGNASLQFTVDATFHTKWWMNFCFPLVMWPAAYFKFRERTMR